MTRPDQSPTDILTAAQLSAATKQKTPYVDGWDQLDLSEPLSMLEGYNDNDGSYFKDNASAYVKKREVDGKTILAVVFKGTDKFCHRDWKDNLLNINSHYEKMRPLIEALDLYVELHNIDKVMVVGHSLGGAMVAKYMEEHPESENGVEYSGISFGSPGGIFSDDHYDPRMVCIRHEQDAIPRLASKRSMIAAGYRWPGRILQVKESEKSRFKGITGLFKSHSIKEYRKTVEHLAQERIFDVALKVDRDVVIERSGDPREPEKCQARILSDLPDVGVTADEARELVKTENQTHDLDAQEPEEPVEDLNANQGLAMAI
jgi:pimeloyl-ACP methyl ester carboxylesterase